MGLVSKKEVPKWPCEWGVIRSDETNEQMKEMGGSFNYPFNY